ncbi:MAG TPA: ferredoxin [Candidatus Paceibacterota bacterium]|nr:ferredoxin [Candidatus Paceibacterota bacterium]HOK97262.1 ferredoxin [Candidatus Paceibacterota bacterium]HPC30834.1 ferredoxin [Candidatus Pacearchaeota archaeon]HPP64697.1 ferredoxin [Candidatus Paceibacterota bacterium]HRR95035.1 ferredoxin [Candidatus Paceibacterota bacterium]
MKKTIKVNINRNKCLGCGMCVNLCPEVFELKNGKSSLKEKVNSEKYKDCVREAIQNCPVQAIKII